MDLESLIIRTLMHNNLVLKSLVESTDDINLKNECIFLYSENSDLIDQLECKIKSACTCAGDKALSAQNDEMTRNCECAKSLIKYLK